MAIFKVKIYKKEYQEMFVCANNLAEAKKYMTKTTDWKDHYKCDGFDSITQIMSPKELDEDDLDMGDHHLWCFDGKGYGWVDDPQPYEAFYDIKSHVGPFKNDDHLDLCYDEYIKLKEEAKQKFFKESYL